MAALRHVVREYGGSVEVDSVPHQGTVFRFLLDERRISGMMSNVRRPRASLMPHLS
jgi:hypothetical protein